MLKLTAVSKDRYNVKPELKDSNSNPLRSVQGQHIPQERLTGVKLGPDPQFMRLSTKERVQ